jgi:Family of unknown function (DUF6527)
MLTTITHTFVQAIPDELEEGALYISLEYRTAVHKCACGCGRNVITPLHPKQWTLSYDGKVSLHPSIGNWSFPCQSHYFIRQNSIVWAENFSKTEIEFVKKSDRVSLEHHYTPYLQKPITVSPRKEGAWSRLFRKLFG